METKKSTRMWRAFSLEWIPEFRGYVDICRFKTMEDMSKTIITEVVDVLFLSPQPESENPELEYYISYPNSYSDLQAEGSVAVVGYRKL